MSRQALLLDLDGTLVDSVPDLASSLNRLMDRRSLPGFSGAEVTAMVGDGAAALVTRAMQARGRPMAAIDLTDFLTDYTDHAADQTRPYPGAEQTLSQLVGQGWRIGVCTNKPEKAARAVLEALGLLDFFVAVAGGDTYPTRKPDPAHLLNLLATMGMGADDAVMVGDHHNDVLAAHAAGVPCIFAAWGYGNLKMAAGTVAVARQFDALPGLLAAIG